MALQAVVFALLMHVMTIRTVQFLNMVEMRVDRTLWQRLIAQFFQVAVAGYAACLRRCILSRLFLMTNRAIL